MTRLIYTLLLCAVFFPPGLKSQEIIPAKSIFGNPPVSVPAKFRKDNILLPDSLYWGQTPPGDSAVVFAPGLISLPNRRETKLVFSPNGMECLIGTGQNGTFSILYSNHYGGYWTAPAPASFITNTRPIEPFFSPDSLHIFFTSLSDIYVCNRVNQTWSTPVKLPNPVNTNYEEYHPTVTSNGTLYFCSMRENSTFFIYRSRLINGNYTTVEKLGPPVNVYFNQQICGAWDPYISPDESYMIFTSLRTGGYGQEDQYISYNRNGNWTNPKNLGHLINSNLIEYGSYVSPDGKYYFFSRPAGWSPDLAADIYWVSAEFVERLKHTNFAPYLKNQIPNQTDTAGKPYTYTFPDSTFFDDDGNSTLTYSAVLNNGSPLPGWLVFNPLTRTFSGTPESACTLSIKVSAADTANAYAPCTFPLEVFQRVSVDPINGIMPEYKLFQNYPNPFNPNTVISYSLTNDAYVTVKIYNLLGKEIAKLLSSFQKSGLHEIHLNSNNLNLSSGIYFYTLSANESKSDIEYKETKTMSYIK